MRFTPALILVPLFAGCPVVEPGVDHGRLQLCMDGEPSAVDGDRAWDVAGTIVSDEPGDACGTGVGQLLTLEQADGTQRVFGYADTTTLASGDARGTGRATLGAEVGAAVTLKVISHSGWSMDLAFELRDEAGHLLAAGEEGYDTTLDLPELAVGVGEATGPTEQDGCGEVRARLLRLSSPEGAWADVDVAPGESEILDMAGASDDPWSVQVLNLGAWSYEGQVQCTDTWGPTPWFAVGATVFFQF